MIKMSKKYQKMSKKSNIQDVNEYMTITCYNYKNIHKQLGANKIYKCEKCKI